MKRKDIETIEGALRQVHEAQRVVEALLYELCPVGERVTYRHGDHLIEAEVVDHSYDRLRVRGRTGKTYWIDAFRLST